jgi:hypothetical protein
MGSGTLIKFQAQGYGANYGTDLAFYTGTTGGANSTPAIYLTGTNNRVGINTGSPSAPLDVYGISRFTNSANSAQYTEIYTTGAVGYFNVQSNSAWYNGYQHIFTYAGSLSSEGMRLSSTGNLLVGVTSTGSFLDGNIVSYGIGTRPASCFKNDGNGQFTTSIWNAGAGGTPVTLIQFVYGSGATTVGSVTYNGTNTLYNITSDYRIKSDFEDFIGLDIILKLKPSKFRVHNSKNKMAGFIAHELQEYIPQAVNGIKDAIDKNGNAIYQGVDVSQISPFIVKAIQELNEKLVRNNIN